MSGEGRKETMKTMFYVQVRPARDRSGRVARSRAVSVVGMTKNLPALAAGDIAVAVELDIPIEAFQPHAVGLVVQPKRGVIAVEQPDLRDGTP